MITRMRLVGALVAAAVASLLGLQHVAVPAPRASLQEARVIVQAPGAEGAAADAVRRLGGTVTTPLPIVAGFAASVPDDAVHRLAATPGVRAVTADKPMRPAEYESSGNIKNINSVFVRAIGADVLAEKGLTGEGVRVALVDSGVFEHNDLKGRIVPVADPHAASFSDDPESLVPCANFSGEDSCADTFGHGTFLAGLIAGNGSASDDGRFAGVAPDAEIVSVKVGGADGSADVSKVLAGIQWVVSFAEEYDIEVLNLAWGTDSTASPHVDPLNLAVQRAWVEGITVVVSAGNFGKDRSDEEFGTITKPGDDPMVVTTGAVDDRESPDHSDDRLPAFSSWGPTAHGRQKPDVVAPGARLVSLLAPGSTVANIKDINTLPDTSDAPAYVRGSGTSMAAAVTSGLAALLLQASFDLSGEPTWTPDHVKAALKVGAQKVAFDDPNAVGAGLVNGPAALAADVDPNLWETVLSDGSGSLEGSRGRNRTTDQKCSTLDSVADDEPQLDEHTAQCKPWVASAYRLDWTPNAWYASQWAGSDWQSSAWVTQETNPQWLGSDWQGSDWQGSSWDDDTDEQYPDYGVSVPGSGLYGVWEQAP